MNGIFENDSEINELNEYLDELQKLRGENLCMTQKLTQLSASKERILKENKSLKEKVQTLETKLETITNQYIATDNKISELNKELKNLLKAQRVWKKEKTKMQNDIEKHQKEMKQNIANSSKARKSRTDLLHEANAQRLGSTSCVLFGTSFW